MQGSTAEGEANQSGGRWEGFAREVESSRMWKDESLNQVIKVGDQDVQRPEDQLTFPGRIGSGLPVRVWKFCPTGNACLLGLTNSHLKA